VPEEAAAAAGAAALRALGRLRALLQQAGSFIGQGGALAGPAEAAGGQSSLLPQDGPRGAPPVPTRGLVCSAA
jgi:hypothetical protein